jgi:outer membrane cobalamin receptor
MRILNSWLILLTIAACAAAQTQAVAPDTAGSSKTERPLTPPDSLWAVARDAQPADSLLAAQHPAGPDITRRTIAPFFADSTSRIGSGYGSAADLFASFPAAYAFDRGSIGLPALGALFAASPARLALVYDRFCLADPLTGRSDLNLIPVESIATLALFTDAISRPFPGLAASQTLEITSRDLAADTLRSQVAYRTGGRGYDDIDVRAGLRYSERLSINAGGILKNYAGTTSQLEKYRAQKINLALTRTFGHHWRTAYCLLYNTFDLDLPLSDKPLLASTLAQPHQKESRYDHGLEVQYDERWLTTLQITDHHRERYGYRHSVWDERTDALRFDLRTMARLNWRSLEGTIGLDYRRTGMKSGDWGDHAATRFAGWGSVMARMTPALLAAAQLRIEKEDGEAVALLPQVQLRYGLSQTPQVRAWQAIAWYERTRAAASLAERFEQSPFALGDPELSAESADHLGLGLRCSSAALQLFASVSASRLRDEVLLFWDASRLLPRYQNQPEQQRVSLDGSLAWRLSSWFTLTGKIKQMFYDETTSLNQPATAAISWLQINHIFFRRDLDIRLRLGCSFWGERRAPVPWYVEASPESALLAAVAVPWLQAAAVIKDATLFFLLQNPLGIDYQVVGGYPQPEQLIRWGFVWNFYN